MYKKKRNTGIENECSICGGIIWGKGEKVLIEGAKITVCSSCAQYGKKIITKNSQVYKKQPSVYKASVVKSNFTSKKKNILDSSMEIVSDYAKRIRDTRAYNKLNQEQFAQKLNEKPSLLRRIESGKAKPTEKLAKKIEKVYSIKLLKKVDELVVNTKKYMKRDTASSLGDIAFVKKKKDK